MVGGPLVGGWLGCCGMWYVLSLFSKEYREIEKKSFLLDKEKKKGESPITRENGLEDMPHATQLWAHCRR